MMMSTVLALTLAVTALAFEHTVPLIAYSSAPSADLSLLRSSTSFTGSMIKLLHFSLATTASSSSSSSSLPSSSSSFCPTGSSSLLILSSPHLSSDFNHLAYEIKQRYNQVGRGSHRLKSVYTDVERVKGMFQNWQFKCQGEVVMEQVDSADALYTTLIHHEQSMSDPLLTLITSLPVKELTASTPLHLSRRRLTTGSASSSPNLDVDKDKHDNSTMPVPNAGVFERYTLVNPSLIFTLTIFVGIFVPVIWLGISALSTIHCPRGLQHKTTGCIGEIKSN